MAPNLQTEAMHSKVVCDTGNEKVKMAWKTNYNVAKSVIIAIVVGNNTGWGAKLFISLY